MNTYKWKTIVQGIVGADYEVQESLDDDITEICQKGGWEVWQIDIIHWSDTYTNPKGVRVSDYIVQRVVTLRGEDPTQNMPKATFQSYANSVEAKRRNKVFDEEAYTLELEHFYLKVKEILGL